MLIVVALATTWSAIGPADWATWFFELLVGAIGVAVLVLLYPRYRFSALIYAVVAVHYVIFAIGAKYTYADEPFFGWLRDIGLFSRNHFDRVGHFAQGFTPALLPREVLMRAAGLRRGKILILMCLCVPLAFSAFYELIEWWWVLAFYPGQGPEWLGMQGDPWDAQSDMFAALCGAATALLLLSRLQDRSIGSSAFRKSS
jgi:putative membrane protein